MVLFHGLPGNEKNLDLAQAVRRAGWDVITLNYRCSWGSPGTFSFNNSLEDALAVLAYLREPANVSKLRVDTSRLVIAAQHGRASNEEVARVVAWSAAHVEHIRRTYVDDAAVVVALGERIGSGPL